MNTESGLERLAVITLTKQGNVLADRIRAAIPTADLYVSTKYGPVTGERRFGFDGKLDKLLAEIFGRYDGLVFLMATGIVVRMIAPYIQDKRYDPAVVVMDITGKFAISLLSGHLGGANDLARRLGEITGAIPVVTTGTDVNETIAPDLLAMEIGGEVDDFEAMKKVSAALVDGDPVGIANLAGVRVKTLEGPLKPNVRLHPDLRSLAASDAKAAMVITERLLDLAAAVPGRPAVILRPKTLGVGLGCNRDPSAEEIGSAFDRILAEHGLSTKSVRNLATAAIKRAEAGLNAFAAVRGLRVDYYEKEALNAVEDVPNPSVMPMKHVGVQGVAEPAAMLSAGGPLVVPKVKSGNLTLAVAMIPDLLT